MIDLDAVFDDRNILIIARRYFQRTAVEQAVSTSSFSTSRLQHA
jgi:hypothetical protein